MVAVVLLLAPALLVGGLMSIALSSGTIRHQNAAGGAVNAAGIPAAYLAWIQKAGTVCPQVSSPLIAAQIDAESGFTDATSPAGAQGPAQFLPSTWASMAVDGDGNGVKDIHSIPDAVMSMAALDCSTQAQLAKDFPSASAAALEQMTLAAYNAGLGAVLSAGGVPGYAETQAYVQRIEALKAGFTAASAGSGGDTAVVATARTELGKPYVWGASGPDSFDCSGLVDYVYAQQGISLPRTTFDMAVSGSFTTLSGMSGAQPGDIVLFQVDGAGWDHVGIYIGGGQMIHAPQPGETVTSVDLTSSYWQGLPQMWRRVGASA